jgi:hypothetical protein
MLDDAETTQVYMPPRDAIRRLMEEGVVHGLDDAALDQLRAECWDDSEEEMEEVGVLGILTSFYEGVERGLADGFVWRGLQFWNDTDDAVAEIARALGEPKPLFRQISARETVAHVGGRRETVLAIELERDDGERLELQARSLGDVAALFNRELHARAAARRLIALDTSGEWEMFVALDLKLARKLVGEGVLPVHLIDQLND